MRIHNFIWHQSITQMCLLKSVLSCLSEQILHAKTSWESSHCFFVFVLTIVFIVIPEKKQRGFVGITTRTIVLHLTSSTSPWPCLFWIAPLSRIRWWPLCQILHIGHPHSTALQNTWYCYFWVTPHSYNCLGFKIK